MYYPTRSCPKHVTSGGSNHRNINVVDDRIPGRAIVISAIDNLVKGASGQAIQNMNIMMGWDETSGLQGAPMFP